MSTAKRVFCKMKDEFAELQMFIRTIHNFQKSSYQATFIFCIQILIPLCGNLDFKL